MFQSVDDFLRKANGSKTEDRKLIDEEIAPTLEDPDTVGVPPELLNTMETLFEEYGDEAFRQVALFCLGAWLQIHGDFLEQYKQNDSTDYALMTTYDMSRLTLAMEIAAGLGSFGGDEGWRAMLRDTMIQKVLESCEEDGIDVHTYFNDQS